MSLRTIIRGLGFAEAPRWRDGALWFVDYFSKQVLKSDLQGAYGPVALVEGTPGGLGWLPDGTPLVVSQRDFKLLAISQGGALSEYADLSAHARGAANELFVDPQGHAFVGHHGFDFFGGGEARPSSLLRVDLDGSVTVAAADLVFPNGCALLPDGRTLVVAESFANRLTAFDVAADGTLSGRREWADLGPHTPDGICVDAEGAIWAGSPMTASFVRVREGGEILQEIHTEDGRWAVACSFVGAGLETLCCVTAATTPEDMREGRSEAFIELADVSVPGAPQ